MGPQRCGGGRGAGVVTLFPMWLAPNLITLLGTGGLVVGYMVSAYYLPEFQGAAPDLPALDSLGLKQVLQLQRSHCPLWSDRKSAHVSGFDCV